MTSVRRLIRQGIVDRLPDRGRLWIERAYLRPHFRREIEILRRYCRPDRSAVDIGANQGDFSLFLSQFASLVYCFEPVPEMVARLRSRLRSCNVMIQECALASAQGNMCLHIPLVQGQEVYTRSSLAKSFQGESIQGQPVKATTRVEVPVRRLDDFRPSNVNFIKIDVEGYELEVLRGARRTIQENWPTLFVEIEERHHPKVPISAVFSEICGLGYEGYFQDEAGALRGLDEFELGRMQDPSKEGTRAFVNNFLFLGQRRKLNPSSPDLSG